MNLFLVVAQSSTTTAFLFDVDASSHAGVSGSCKSTSPHSGAAPLPAAIIAGVESLESLAPARPCKSGPQPWELTRNSAPGAVHTSRDSEHRCNTSLDAFSARICADADRNLARGRSRRAQVSAGKEGVVRGRAEAPCSSSLGILASGTRGGHVVTRPASRVGERPFPAICMRILHGQLESPHRGPGAADSLRFGVSATR